MKHSFIELLLVHLFPACVVYSGHYRHLIGSILSLNLTVHFMCHLRAYLYSFRVKICCHEKWFAVISSVVGPGHAVVCPRLSDIYTRPCLGTFTRVKERSCLGEVCLCTLDHFNRTALSDLKILIVKRNVFVTVGATLRAIPGYSIAALVSRNILISFSFCAKVAIFRVKIYRLMRRKVLNAASKFVCVYQAMCLAKIAFETTTIFSVHFFHKGLFYWPIGVSFGSNNSFSAVSRDFRLADRRSHVKGMSYSIGCLVIGFLWDITNVLMHSGRCL